jgi:hypothetical protein
MNRASAIALRIFAVIVALLFGLMLGLLRFIDTVSPSTGEVVASLALYTLLGAALQAGLFWSPSAMARGPTAMLLCVALMLPMPVLVAAQFADLVSDVLRNGYGELAGHPRGDGTLYAGFLAVLLTYTYAIVNLLQRAFARQRSNAPAATRLP